MQENLSSAAATKPTRRSLPLAAMVLVAIAGLPHAAAAQGNPLQPQAPQPRPANPAETPPPPPAAGSPKVNDGPSYEVSAFVLRYPVDQPDRPPLDELLNLPITLAIKGGIYVAPGDGGEETTMRLEDLASVQRGLRRFSVSAINAIGTRIVKDLNQRGIIGVLIVPDSAQIDPDTLEDRRPAAVRTLNLDIWTRSVSQVRSLGTGPRWSRDTAPGDRPSAENRINHPFHQRIRDNSPLQPSPPPEAGQRPQAGDLLRRDSLDDYLYRLNRHPGRRVDVAIASAETPGDVVLDYLITENKPWTIYFQLSNTGTKETSEWRQRFGFIHDQFTNHDDTLSIDFITAGFDQANAVIASYETPLGGSESLRLKIFGSLSEFTASDVGFANEKFIGNSWTAGAELIANIVQVHQTFVDAFVGARWENHRVDNQAVDVKGDADFFIPFAGLRLERNTLHTSTGGEIRLEGSLADVANSDSTQVQRLGRLNPDEDWTVLRASISHSFYLEPLIQGAAWSDPASSDRQTTLAHEIAVSLRGQYSFGNRLIPQAEEVVGGLYSVRGYPESLIAGDDSIIASAEYRFHLPRALAIQPDPSKTPLFGKPFRFAPEQRYGRPDWDLIFKGFVDAARVTNSDRETFESDETLIGAGIGTELVFRRNLNVRLDWGFALQDAGQTDAGDNRVHLSITLLY